MYLISANISMTNDITKLSLAAQVWKFLITMSDTLEFRGKVRIWQETLKL